MSDPVFTKYEQAAIAAARRAMQRVLREPGVAVTSPATVRSFLAMHLSGLEHEVFAVLYLDAQNRLVLFETPFRGTVNQTAVYPREIAKRALEVNAMGVVLAHNHPSGATEPSAADRNLTNVIRAALALFDITVLDHVIVAGDASLSFAERGLL